MKKRTPKLPLFIMILAAAFSLTACGKSNKKDSAGKKEEITQEKTDEKKDETDEKKDETDEKKDNSLYNTVADYVNADEMRTAIDNLRSSLPEGISIDLLAEGNKLIYYFAYETIAHVEGDGMVEALEAAIAEQDAVFQQTADSVKMFVNEDEVVVEIRYVDMNGAVIYSKTYTSQ